MKARGGIAGAIGRVAAAITGESLDEEISRLRRRLAGDHTAKARLALEAAEQRAGDLAFEAEGGDTEAKGALTAARHDLREAQDALREAAAVDDRTRARLEALEARKASDRQAETRRARSRVAAEHVAAAAAVDAALLQLAAATEVYTSTATKFEALSHSLGEAEQERVSECGRPLAHAIARATIPSLRLLRHGFIEGDWDLSGSLEDNRRSVSAAYIDERSDKEDTNG